MKNILLFFQNSVLNMIQKQDKIHFDTVLPIINIHVYIFIYSILNTVV